MTEIKSLNPDGILFDLSVVIVSFNTREVLRKCLETLEAESQELSLEVLVVDNGSRDQSVEMVAADFPEVRLIHSGTNLGFAGANNLMFPQVRGRYVVLLNSDAFLRPGALRIALERMDAEPEVGLAGGRLIGEDGAWQPSARLFPSNFNDFLSLTGLAHRFRTSRFFGRADRTWADPLEETETDWVPGAFSILRSTVLERIGGFDEAFFLYYEEVDLCRRIKAAGFKIQYWPDIVVVHLGGESSKSMPNAARSASGAQLTLWRLRSGYLYYRKHHASAAWRSMAIEYGWHWLRLTRNRFSKRLGGQEKAAESRITMTLVRRAWKDTRGGRISPPRPW
jgi:GT2 family glycosyltransferase